VVAVGGSDAGISAALRVCELAPGSEVTVLVADAYLNYSICGILYYLAARSSTGSAHPPPGTWFQVSDTTGPLSSRYLDSVRRVTASAAPFAVAIAVQALASESTPNGVTERRGPLICAVY